LYISDTGNNAIRQIDMVTGEVSILAGGDGPDSIGTEDGVGWDAQFDAPTQLAMVYDHLFVMEQNRYRVRRIALPIQVISPTSVDAVLAGIDTPYVLKLSRS
jgi:hypothetical protein